MNLTAPLLAATAKLLSGATVRWHECQPDTCQRVYFANHTSHLDALVLWSSLPGEIRELTPVYIDNLNRVLPRGEFLPVPLLSCITIGPPMWLEPKENKFDFLKRARQAVLRLKDL